MSPDRQPWTGTPRVQVPPLPDVLIHAVNGWRVEGAPEQPPIAWPRDRWVEAFPEYEIRLISLPARLGRVDVRVACRDADPTLAFVICMAWGYGTVGYGPWRTQRALRTADADGRLARAIETLRWHGPVPGYRALADANHLDGLGPAFATKFLFFHDEKALVLDRLIARFFTNATGLHLRPTEWRDDLYAAYLAVMDSWSTDLGLSPSRLEQVIFQAEARNAGNQWAD